MKIYSGKYSKETLESNSLVQNLLKYPEISSTITRQYPQYSVSYFVDGTGRFAKEDMIGDNKFQWAIQGRTNRPSTCTGTSTGTGASNAQFSVEFEENYFNPYDLIRFQSGVNAIVLGEPTSSAGGWTFQMKLQSNDTASAIVAADVVGGITVGKIGTQFPEKSQTGFQNHAFPDWHTNYIGINRKSFDISGSALTDITWVENNGQRLWYFKDEEEQRETFMYENEFQDWYGRSTMDVSGNCTTIDPSTGRPLVSGDGILAQIDASNIDTYSGVLTHNRLTDFLALLGMNTGISNNRWMVYTGTAGMVAFHNAMVSFLMPSGSGIYDLIGGKEITIGPNFKSYSAMGHTMTLVWAPIFDDPNIHSAVDPISGLLKESFRMVFLNFGIKAGESNIERKIKGAGGMNRGLIMKYRPGMMNPYDMNSMTAPSSNDSFGVDYLREAGIVVRNPLSCGMLIFA